MTRWLVAIAGIFVGHAAAQESPSVLTVMTTELPVRFAPFGNLTRAERIAQDLIFESLIVPADEGRWRPGLAESIPAGQGSQPTFRLRAGAKWSDGRPVSAGDVRHTVRQTLKRADGPLAYADWLGDPRLGATAGDIEIPLAHGAVDPWPLFDFPIVPQVFQGHDLDLELDVEFQRRPVGSGPFIVVGPTKIDGHSAMVFRKNSHHPSAGRIPFDEIHWFAGDAKLAKKLRPHVIIDVPGVDTGAKGALTRRVWTVVPNQRRPMLADRDVRRFLGLSLKRDDIVGAGRSVVGLAPRESWTQAPKPRVPDDLALPEAAQSLAQSLSKTHKGMSLGFLFPADQAEAMGMVIEQWQSAAKTGGLALSIDPRPRSEAELRDAVASREFDLALLPEDWGDHPTRVAALFDRREQALGPGGSNVAGIRDDTLRTLVDGLTLTRQFPLLRAQMRNIHVHLVQTMPIVPLWRHEANVSTRGVRTPPFDPLRPFARIADWRRE